MTEIILQKNLLADGLVRFDLIAEQLPKNFLGLAADIHFDSSLIGADYQGMVLSPPMKALADQGKLIDMVKPELDQGVIVLGLTQKASALSPLNDGVLASFTLKNQDLQVAGFSNQVLSVYENGRKDLKAQWSVGQSKGLPVAEKFASTLVSLQQPSEPVASEELVDQDSTDLSSEQLSIQPETRPFIADSGDRNVDWTMFWLLPSILIVLALLIAYILNRYKGRLEKQLTASDLRLVQGADFA